MSLKDIITKNHTYYFFDDIISMKDFDLNNTEIVLSCKSIRIYCIRFLTIKKT